MIAIHKNMNIYHRIVASFIAVLALIGQFLINYSLFKIPKGAHRLYNKLNSIITRKPPARVSNWKVLGLIEKLSGPVIGIYFLDIFPITNYEYYLYISYCIQNFILLIGLFGY